MSKTEMKVGWTKGPWSVVHKVPTLVNGNFRSVADTACGRNKRLDLAEDLANACLISKAPEMAELLRVLVEFWLDDGRAISPSAMIGPYDDNIGNVAAQLLREIGGAQ